jgi:hypothetical protein
VKARQALLFITVGRLQSGERVGILSCCAIRFLLCMHMAWAKFVINLWKHV